MILGLDHLGLTVSKMDNSIKFYQEVLDLKVLSDGERKGDWVEKVTGVPGLHTRNVYLSVAPYKYLELSEFYHPKTIPSPKRVNFRIGILYYAFIRESMGGLLELARAEKEQEWFTLMEVIGEEPYQESRVVTLQDPDGLLLRVIQSGKEQIGSRNSSWKRLLYPVLIVDNIESSIRFYQDILGFEIDSRGGPLTEKRIPGQDAVQWVLLKASTGPCLKLIHPLDFEILKALPWQMERVGFTHVAFGVKNLEDYLNLVKRKLDITSNPQFVPVGPHKGGKIIYITTPDGMKLEFIDSPLIIEQAAKI